MINHYNPIVAAAFIIYIAASVAAAPGILIVGLRKLKNRRRRHNEINDHHRNTKEV